MTPSQAIATSAPASTSSPGPSSPGGYDPVGPAGNTGMHAARSFTPPPALRPTRRPYALGRARPADWPSDQGVSQAIDRPPSGWSASECGLASDRLGIAVRAGPTGTTITSVLVLGHGDNKIGLPMPEHGAWRDRRGSLSAESGCRGVACFVGARPPHWRETCAARHTRPRPSSC